MAANSAQAIKSTKAQNPHGVRGAGGGCRNNSGSTSAGACSGVISGFRLGSGISTGIGRLLLLYQGRSQKGDHQFMMAGKNYTATASRVGRSTTFMRGR